MIEKRDMGYIPADAEWYIADVIMEIIVHGADCNVVHRNLVLINAHSPEEAYEKAVRIGKEGETEYENPKGQAVEIRFRGISKFDVVYEPLEDGSELAFQEQVGVSEADFQQMIPPKGSLEVFTSPHPGEEHNPDYSSKEVVEEAVRMLGGRDRDPH
jgi:hypothetical protein